MNGSRRVPGASPRALSCATRCEMNGEFIALIGEPAPGRRWSRDGELALSGELGRLRVSVLRRRSLLSLRWCLGLSSATYMFSLKLGHTYSKPRKAS